MAPTFIQVQSATASNASSITEAAFPVGSGANRTLVAIVAWMDNTAATPTVSSIIFNTSENFTFRARGQLTFGGDNTLTAEVWTLDNPTNATADVVATLSEANNAGDGLVLLVHEYTGANNGVGANVGTGSGTSTDSSVTFATGAADSLIVGGGMLFIGTVDAHTPGANTDERSEVHTNNVQSWSGDEPATGGSDTFNVTHSSARWVLAAIELKAAAGGGGNNYTEAGFAVTGYIAAGGDVGGGVDGGPGTQGWLSSASDSAALLDAGAGVWGYVSSGVDVTALLDTGFAVWGVVAAGNDGAAVFYDEAGAGVAGWECSGADMSALVDAGFVVVGAITAGGDVGGGVDGGAPVLGWVVAGPDVQALVDGGYSLVGWDASGAYEEDVDPGAALHPVHVRQIARAVGQAANVVRGTNRKVK